MKSSQASPTICCADEIIARLDSFEPGLLSFDGDGTLWTGDVGEDVFVAAVRAGFLLDAALEGLLAMAQRCGTSRDGDANAIADGLFAGYRRGVVDEREICDMMSWCFAGHVIDNVRAFIDGALCEAAISSRRIAEIGPIVEWARARNHRVVIVSASPQLVVEQASQIWQWDRADVLGSPAATDDGACVLPRLSAPTPYGPTKVTRTREHVGPDVPWLAAFGDNIFDVDMLAAAAIRVAVRPKPRLRERFGTLDGLVELVADDRYRL